MCESVTVVSITTAMASMLCKSAVRVASRTLANRSKTKSLPFLFSSPSSTYTPRASRILAVIGSVESLMPLHSAIANARLTSNIALDSNCWSWLSQGAFGLLAYRHGRTKWDS